MGINAYPTQQIIDTIIVFYDKNKNGLNQREFYKVIKDLAG